jgi:hypothetical protein
MTSLTVAKSQIRSYIYDFIDSHISNTEDNIQVITCAGSPSKKANRLIQEFKQIVFTHSSEYSGVAGIALSIITKRLSKVRAISLRENPDRESIFNLIYSILELCYFILSMSPRVRIGGREN